MESILKWVESGVELILRSPPLIGIMGSWTMTQAHKWMTPPESLADFTDAQRGYRTRQVAFISGMVFTLLAYMNPEVRTEASATLCYGAAGLGFGVCMPPLKAYVVAPIIGVSAIVLWDVVMFAVESRWPEFYKRYISGKPVHTFLDLPNGTVVEVVVDSKGRFLKLRTRNNEGEDMTTLARTDL